MEIRRISSRNLGRDDRVISDHAREARFPFLDENVVTFLNSLPLHDKVRCVVRFPAFSLLQEGTCGISFRGRNNSKISGSQQDY